MEFGELLKALLLDLQSLFRFQVSNPDLTLPQILLLSTISDEGVDMSSLSKQMGVDNSTMTRLIDVLIRNGWAIKYKNKKDGRVVMVEITKKGEVLREEIDKNIDKFGYEIYNSISQEDREEVMEILTEFHWVLSKNLLRSK
uniref:HTH-type transcriptional regulator SarZ n=1 Tax=uncultured marine group II/III euryarchaeote KM3_86_F07 TaxID=1456529 RepID=A0A075HUA0_9EURY|nr:transcriptional regulator [uncultured marine group II/III euryarchaeote KM3_86_F07]